MATLSTPILRWNIVNMVATPVSGPALPIASVTKMHHNVNNNRIKGQDNNVVHANVGSQCVSIETTWDLTTNDYTTWDTIRKWVGPFGLTWTAVPFTDATSYAVQGINKNCSLTGCVIDTVDEIPAPKGMHEWTLTGHCIATSDDADNYSEA
jgi:hypothetical protein